MPYTAHSIFSDFFNNRDFSSEIDRKLFRPLVSRSPRMSDMLMNTPSKIWGSDMLMNTPSKIWCGVHNLMENPSDIGMDIESLGPNCQYA